MQRNLLQQRSSGPPHGLGPRGLPVRGLYTRVRLQHAKPVANPRALPLEALDADVASAALQLLQHSPLMTPVAAPCSLMNCGDVIHRSTLDPILRREVLGPSWQLFALLAAAGLYLFSTPGVLPGWYDYYIAARIAAQKQRAIDKSDLALGKKLGSGAFGSVFRATLAPEKPGDAPTNVIVKKAKEFGEAEVWMNERMMRYSPEVAAEFISAFEEVASDDPKQGTKKIRALLGGGKKAAAPAGQDPVVWLVWKDEEGPTLWDLMQAKKGQDFPYNLEPLLLGRELRLPKGKRRRLVTLKLAMRQLVEALRDCHATGIVHRDFKPQNTIVSASSRRLKLIDFGAAADLRLGINYVPNEYLLDPRYAPPQQYIMSRQTAKPPPKPVATLLSPVLWTMEGPDRFDMYSVGITLLQLAFPALRSDNGIIAFNKKLKECGYDLNKWRANVAMDKRGGQWPKDLEEGFEVLDADGGEGWDLACKLVTYKPSDRLTAAAALKHPWLAAAPSNAPAGAAAALRAGNVADTLASSVAGAARSAAESIGSAGGTISQSIDELIPTSMLQDAINGSNRGALTEAFLLQEFGDGSSKAAPPPSRDARQTIAWWQGRQQEMQRKRLREVAKKLGAAANAGSGGSNGGTKTPSPDGTRLTGGPARAAAANGRGARTPGGSGFVAAKSRTDSDEDEAAAAASGSDSDGDAPTNGNNGKGAKTPKQRQLLNVFGRR